MMTEVRFRRGTDDVMLHYVCDLSAFKTPLAAMLADCGDLDHILAQDAFNAAERIAQISAILPQLAEPLTQAAHFLGLGPSNRVALAPNPPLPRYQTSQHPIAYIADAVNLLPPETIPIPESATTRWRLGQWVSDLDPNLVIRARLAARTLYLPSQLSRTYPALYEGWERAGIVPPSTQAQPRAPIVTMAAQAGILSVPQALFLREICQDLTDHKAVLLKKKLQRALAAQEGI